MTTSPTPGTIRTYSSPGPSGSVNAHWIVGADGVIVVDALREPSQASILVERIAEDGLPIAAVVVTHSHADHVGGLPTLLAAAPGGATVYATETTATAVREDAGGLRALTRQLLGDDFPADDDFPEFVAVGERQDISVAGVDLVLHDLGAGEAPSMIAVEVPAANEVVVGDLVGNRYTPLLLEGRTAGWLRQLDAARTRLPSDAVAHPGHGASAPLSQLIDEQAEYLAAARELVASKAQGRSELPEDEMTEVVGSLESRFPDYPTVVPEAAQAAGMPPLAVLNVQAVAGELAAESAATA